MVRIRKNAWKIVLDIGMMILLVLLYNHNVLGLAFHEIGGLALGGLFIIHKLLNFRWIKTVSRGLFSRKTPARQRLYWALDILLFLSFGYVLVSGILISKVLFPATNGGGALKMGHYAAAALALALTGVHLGLHLNWMRQRMGFLRKVPRLVRRGLAVILSVAVLAFGAYQMTSTSFISWRSNLGVVFSATGTSATGEMTDVRNGASSATDAQAEPEVINLTDGSTATVLSGSSGSTDLLAQSESSGNGNGNGFGGGNGGGPHGSGGKASADVMTVLTSFLSILLAFAVVVGWTDAWLMARKRRRILLRTLHGRAFGQPAHAVD